jgi:hypothetical protein
MTSKLLILSIVFSAFACSTKSDDTMNVKLLESPAGHSSAEPSLFTASDGSTYLSWVEKHDDKADFRFSKLVGSSWTEPVLIDSGRNWFVNWADYPMMASNGSQLVAHYLAKSGEGTFAYDIKLTTSADEGKTWATAAVLHDDGKQAEHGFVSIIPYGENFFIAWLDGRNTVMEGMENMDHHEGHHGQMSLRAAVIDKTGKKLNEWELDNRTCDCCQTTAALTDNGPVVIYRDRSDEEIRDMSIVRFINGTWTEPTSIHNDTWKIAGCPVNGPRVASQGNKLVVAWYSVPDGKSQVNVAFSEDGGATFNPPVRIDEGSAIGRVDIVLLDDNKAYVTWMEGTDVKGAKVSKDGKETSQVIASSSEARSSGFPQLTKTGDQLIFAWTDDKEKKVKTATLKL